MTIQQVKARARGTPTSRPNQGATAGSNRSRRRPAGSRRPPRRARCCSGSRRSSSASRPREPDRARRASSRAAATPSQTVTYGAAARRQDVRRAEHRPRAAEAGHASTSSSASTCMRNDIPAKVTRHATRTCTTSACPGCCTARRPAARPGPATASTRQAALGRRELDQEHRARRSLRKGDFLGVVAPNEQDAIQAAAQLKVKWAETKTMPGNGNLWKHFRERQLAASAYAAQHGSIDNGLARPRRNVREASYSVSLPVARVVRPLVRRRGRHSADTADGVGREPEHLRHAATSVSGLLGLPARTDHASTSPRAPAATAATSRTTRALGRGADVAARRASRCASS